MTMLIPGRIVAVVAISFSCCGAACAQKGTVSVKEGSLQIPTYRLGSEDQNPQFQLLTDHDIYPYTMLDDLTDTRQPATYRAIVMENQYLRATILPQLGGRLYSLYDKVAGREVFYRNGSIKYGLVALRGAWISGGIEFNFPNGHTTDTVSTVSSRVETNSDGSATVFVGDVDQVSEMYWEVALTLRPGVARLEQHVRLFNPTATDHLYWYWNNAAVPATSDARFIYPMRVATPGEGADLETYPEWHGVDLSRYDSFHQPSELFAQGVHRNFFGVYYADPNYGLVHVADHHEVTGKKFWTWGVAGDGTIWTGLLTDTDGPYNEIQAGRFETQFNREFMPAQAQEDWTEYWYPVNKLDGGFVEATSQFALNVLFVPSHGSSGEIRVYLCPTVRATHASLVVRQDGKQRERFDDLAFEPGASRTFIIPDADLQLALKAVSIELRGASGETLLHWNGADPVDGNAEPRASGTALMGESPKQVEGHAEELFLSGLQAEKHGNRESAHHLFEESLKRDPDYIPALRKLAIENYLGCDFDAAKENISRALLRDDSDTETLYEAGIIWRASGDPARASDYLWSAVRRGRSPAPALLQLGEIALSNGDYAAAQSLLRRALTYQPDNVRALCDLSMALRLGGKALAALEAVNRAVKTMPLFPLALAEQWRLKSLGRLHANVHRSQAITHHSALEHRLQTYLEAGSSYWSLKDYDSSKLIFEAAVRDFSPAELSPMVYYYLASCAHHGGNATESARYATKARSISLDKAFVDRIADAQVLQEMLLLVPDDPNAQYLLGNDLFQHQRYDQAEALWNRAQKLSLQYSVLYRNLGIDAWKVKKNPEEAKSLYEKAIQLAPQDYRLYVDLDEIDAQLGQTDARSKLFAMPPAGLLDHDAVRVRYILLLMQQHDYDGALRLLANHHFKPWEQGPDVREIFVAAHIQKARQDLASRNFVGAEAEVAQAFEYPVNLGVGKPEKPNDEAAHYWLGEVRSHEGDGQRAAQEWATLAQATGGSDMSRYYAALALDRLGRRSESVERLSLLAEGPQSGHLSAHNYYVAALAERHLGHEADAATYLRKAIDLNPSLWQAETEADR